MVENGWNRDYPAGELDPAYLADAEERARQHMADPQARPCGWIVRRFVLTCVFAVLPALAMAYAAFTMWILPRREGEAAALVFLAMAGVVLYPARVFFRISRPASPRRLLLMFYRAVAGGHTEEARRLVVGADFDGFPRYPPCVPGLARVGAAPSRFGAPDGFQQYWDGLVQPRRTPYAVVRIGRLRVEPDEKRPGVVVARFRLRLVLNTRLSGPLALILLVVAPIYELAARKEAIADLTKILVRVGDEWQLLDGSWEGVAEQDLGWLTRATA